MQLLAALTLGASALPPLLVGGQPVPMISLSGILGSGRTEIQRGGHFLAHTSRDVTSLGDLTGRKIKLTQYGNVHATSPPLSSSPYAHQTIWKTEEERRAHRLQLLSKPLGKGDLEYYHHHYDLWKDGKLWHGSRAGGH